MVKKERFYDPENGGRKVSQLEWKYSNAAILKGAINWEVLPRLSVGASGWTTNFSPNKLSSAPKMLNP